MKILIKVNSIFISLLYLLFLCGCSESITDSKIVNVSISGVVQDSETSQHLADAQIQLVQNNRLAETDSTGRFSFDSLSIAVDTIIISKYHYLTDTVEITISDSAGLTLFEIDLNPRYSYTLEGNILLENQVEHSNALIYIEELNRGVSSDSAGHYRFDFNPSTNNYHGISSMYYFLYDYECDSLEILFDQGLIVLDTLDVNEYGEIRPKTLSQLFLLQGWTDNSTYRIGDTLYYNIKLTNLTTNEIEIVIFDMVFGPDPLTYITLTQDPNHPVHYLPHYPLPPMRDEWRWDISPGYYFEASVSSIIPAGYYGGWGIENPEFTDLLPGEYVAGTRIFLQQRSYPTAWDLLLFALLDWRESQLQRGIAPQYFFMPAKFEFPIISIIE